MTNTQQIALGIILYMLLKIAGMEWWQAAIVGPVLSAVCRIGGHCVDKWSKARK